MDVTSVRIALRPIEIPGLGTCPDNNRKFQRVWVQILGWFWVFTEDVPMVDLNVRRSYEGGDLAMLII